jgi:hypothetical protein
MVSIGHLPGRQLTHPGGVAANGSIIVGASFVDRAHATAFLWDAAHGMRSLQSVLETEYGLDLAGWNLQNASGITPDGSVIVGWGTNSAGQQEAFRVVLSAPSVNRNDPPAAAEASFVDNGQKLNPLAGRGVVLGDFNSDGFPDAFVVNQNTPEGEGHRVYFGDGRGQFTDSGQVLANPSNWYDRPAVGDVNGDGKLDVVTGKTVWLNDGRGRFEAHLELIESTETDNVTGAAHRAGARPGPGPRLRGDAVHRAGRR